MTMRLEVKVENISPDDLDLQIESFTRRLLAYPAEHVLAVIQRWPDDNRFWPAWNDLKVQMDERMAAIESARWLAAPYQAYAEIARDCGCWICRSDRERRGENLDAAANEVKI